MAREAAMRLRGAEVWHETDVLARAREVIGAEARAVNDLIDRVDHTFYEAVEIIRAGRGALIVTGMGKAGLIAQKLTATFASTGVRAHFLHPAEAFHGDLGRVHDDDVVLALSQSGETGEVLQLLPALRLLGVKLIAMTASADSTLGRAATVTLPLGRLEEACSLRLAPSTSTTVMLALGDALALVISKMKGFNAEDFARFHPGGSLGRKLSPVDEHMRPLAQCRVARDSQTVREVLVATTKSGRRPGAIMLVDKVAKLTGLFTDSDLARLIESRHDAALDLPMCEVMAKDPTTIGSGSRMAAAIEIMTERKFSELPVVDRRGRPVGMIDVTDVVGMLPEPTTETPWSAARREWDGPTLRVFSHDEASAAGEFSWPHDELPETD